MKVKIDGTYYSLVNDLNCVFFKSLQEENIEEINLDMFKDVFIKLYKNETIEYNKFDTSDFEYYYKAFTYFGSNREEELISYAFLHFFYIQNKEMALERVEWLENALYNEHDIREYFAIDDRVIDKMTYAQLTNFKQLDARIKNYINENRNKLLKIVKPTIKHVFCREPFNFYD